jgi:hypothetical protein
MQRYKNRILKLENSHGKQSQNCVLFYHPADCLDNSINSNLHVWQLGCCEQSENPTSGPLGVFKGRFMLVPDHGFDEEWMEGLAKQQRKLLADG